jgi:hypothetical protein
MKRIPALMLTLASLLSSTAVEAVDPNCFNALRVHKKKPRISAPKSAAGPVAPTIDRSQITTVTVMNSSGGESCMSAARSGDAVWTDWHCVQLKKSELLWKLGERDAAISLLCSDKDMREALQRTGSACGKASAPPDGPMRAEPGRQ